MLKIVKRISLTSAIAAAVFMVEQAISEFNLKLSWLKNGVYK